MRTTITIELEVEYDYTPEMRAADGDPGSPSQCEIHSVTLYGPQCGHDIPLLSVPQRLDDAIEAALMEAHQRDHADEPARPAYMKAR